MKIHIHTNDERTVDNGTMLLSWCVTKEEIDRLEELDAKNPHLLLIISPVDGYMRGRQERYLIPLKNLQHFIMFHAPGRNRLNAYLLTDKAKNTLHRFGNHDWHFNFLDNEEPNNVFTTAEGEFFETPVGGGRAIAHDTLDVVVPEELFGKPTPDWELPWLTWLVRDRHVIDECHRRKIRMLYPLQVCLFLIYYLMRIGHFGIMLLFGCFEGSLKALTHPLSMTFGEVWKESEYALDPTKWGDKWYSYGMMLLTPFIPFTGMCVGSLFVGHVNLPYHQQMLLPLFGAIVAIMGVLTLVLGATALVALLAAIDHHKDIINWCKSLIVFKKNEKWYLEDDAMIDLTCADARPPVQFKDVPKNRRTIHLRFWDTKSKVCKPFAR